MGNSVTLHSACAYGDLNAVRALLKTATAADLEAKDDSGRTPLLVAVASMSYKRDDDDDDDDDIFGDGFGDDHSDESEEEQEEDAQRGGDELATGSKKDATDEAEEKPRGDGEKGGEGGDERESEEVEEFNENASVEPLSKQAEILHLLMQKHVNLDHQDENGWTALHHACFVQNPVAINMLIHAGAHPMREKFGLLPQDFLLRGQSSEWITQSQDLKETLDIITEKSPYTIKLLAFRPSGIVQLDMGGQVEKGSLVTIEYDVPENHSVKDYIQVLISEESSSEIEIGSYHYVPAGKHGQITISTQSIPSSSTVRFVYVKCDINTISRQVVASGCNAVVQASVGEIFQYELYLYERVVEVESIPEFEFIDQPLIVLKRIGIVVTEDEIDWVGIRPDNHIVAVNDIRIDSMEFTEAVRVLQENNGKKCTKLLMQNYSACGDFIPEKILGIGVVGKYAYLNPLEDGELEAHDVAEHNLDEWIRRHSNSGDLATATVPTLPQPTATSSSSTVSSSHALTSSALRDSEEHQSVEHHDTPAPVATEGKDNLNLSEEDPANVVSEEKISASSTIETVVPLHNSFQLKATGSTTARARRMSVRSSSLITRRVLARQTQSSLLTSAAATSAELHTERRAKYPNGGVNGTAAQHDSARNKQAAGGAHDRRKRQHRPPMSPGAVKNDFFSETKEGDEKKRLVSAYKDGKPLITVIGLGGAGNNAVNNMIASQLEGVEFIVANTDCQALGRSLAPRKITLGKEITKGLGAGSKPQLGKLSAEMQREEIEQTLKDSNMLFITGGMGGGTCTGAAPIVASIARDMGILTVGVVSTPFRSEGPNRTRLANAGVKELAKYVDTLIVVPNQNLLALSNKSTTMLEAFRYADDVLLEGVKGVTDLIVRPGLINLDFADIKTILSNAGRAIMGSGTSSETDRAEKAAEQALVNPLLGDLPTESALGLLVTIRGGDDMTLFEVDRIMDIIRTRVAEEANIIFGTCYDSSLQGSVHVSIIVSGIQTDLISPPVPTRPFVPFSEGKKEQKEEAREETEDDHEPQPAAQQKTKGLFSRFFS